MRGKDGVSTNVEPRLFGPGTGVVLSRILSIRITSYNVCYTKLLRLDRNRNNVVLSRRAYLEEEQAEQRHAFLDRVRARAPSDLYRDEILHRIEHAVES